MFRCVPSWHQRAPRARSWQQRIRPQCRWSRKLAPRYLDRAIRYATIFFVYDGAEGRVRSRLPQEVAILTREAMTAYAGHGATIASWRGQFTGKNGDRRTSSGI